MLLMPMFYMNGETRIRSTLWNAESGTDSSQCPWRDVFERLQDLRDKGCECLNPIVSRAEYEHRDRQCAQILLKLEVSIGSEEEIVPCCRQRQEFPVIDARPPGSTNRCDFVACEERREIPRQGFVKQDAHRGPRLRAPAPAPRPQPRG